MLACTLQAAYSVHEENIKGSLVAGKLADMIVLDQNPFEINPQDLSQLKVVMTIVGGKVAYSNGELS